MVKGFRFTHKAIAIALCGMSAACSQETMVRVPEQQLHRVLAEPTSLPKANPSADVMQTMQWVAYTKDNAGHAYAVVDKKNAQVFLFRPDGDFVGSSPVLLGSAKGDHSVPGIGEKPLSQVRPDERTTPAGRFVTEAGSNLKGEDIYWVDYDAAVSMHRVRAANAKERRLERLASPTPDDNRISYGCINVPAKFFDNAVKPLFAKQAIVYVLPDTGSPQQWFPVAARLRR
jgi:hypothetical protein